MTFLLDHQVWNFSEQITQNLHLFATLLAMLQIFQYLQKDKDEAGHSHVILKLFYQVY